MNLKRIFAVISAAAALPLALSGVTACKKGCDHVYNWTVITPATCSSEGEEQGVCGICGDVKTHITEINPDNHGYGEWDILKPTESTEGKAVKTCMYNPEHKYEVTLPVLTSGGEGYTSSEVTVQPKPLEEGERTFVLANSLGEISFTIPVPARGIQTVGDAVEVGSSLKNLVRRVYGRTSTNINDTEKKPISEFYYEFGDGYTHIIDNINKYERWYTLDSTGQPFGIRVDGVTYEFIDEKPGQVVTEGGRPAVDSAHNDAYMNGYAYRFSYTGNQWYYGTEDFLSGLYQEAKASSNNDFYNQIKTEGGETVYCFGFGRYSSPYYAEIKAEFTLTAEYAVKNLTVYAYIYENTYEEKFVYDSGKGGYVLVEGAQPGGVEYIEYEQTTIAELSPEEAADVPVAPYDEHSLRVKSFDVKNGNIVLDEQNPVTVAADVLKEFNIENVENFAEGINSLAYDPVTVYLRTAEGDKEVNINTLTDLGVLCNYSQSTMQFGLRFQIVGEVTLALKTQSGSFEKVIRINVTAKAPDSVAPQVYVYSDAGYVWSTSSRVTVAVGQPLRFRAYTPATYQDNRVTPTITTANAANATFAPVSGTNDWTFTASQTGSYTVMLTSVLGGKTCTFNITVIQVPTLQQLFDGKTYTGTLQYPRGTVTVTCTVTDAAAGSGTLSILNAKGETEVLSFTYVNGVLTTSHSSGVDNGFEATLNEAYGLVLTHPTGFGDKVESVVVSPNV